MKIYNLIEIGISDHATKLRRFMAENRKRQSYADGGVFLAERGRFPASGPCDFDYEPIARITPGFCLWLLQGI
jgi:hypothetical protein